MGKSCQNVQGYGSSIQSRRSYKKRNGNDNGSITLEIQTCGWFDVKRWVLSFGKDAMVLEPENMRAEILEEVRLMTENYLRYFFSGSRTENDILVSYP